MRAKSILTILFLLSVTVAAVIVGKAMVVKMPAQASAGPEVLIAAAQLAPGTLLRAEDVTWHTVDRPVDSQMILRPTDKQRSEDPHVDEKALAGVFGAAIRMSVGASDPITNDVIVKPGDRDFLRIVLTPGQRAIAIPVKTGGASTGLLDPGDRVDIILTQKFDDRTEPMARRSVSETVAEDLRVLAIDALTTDRQVAMAQQADGFGRTVTLEVTPDQAQKINVATELGKLSLTLRPSGGHVAAAAHQDGATWAGDVSPALGAVNPPAPVTAETATIAVMRGDQAPVAVKIH